jgi:hypothetical protein
MSLLKYIERVQYMHYLIAHKATGTPEEFASKLGIGRSVLMEHLRDLRDLGAVIHYCTHRRSYYYEGTFRLIIGKPDNEFASVGGSNNSREFIFESGITRPGYPMFDIYRHA